MVKGVECPLISVSIARLGVVPWHITTQLERLNLPPVDLEEVAWILQDFDRRFESDSNPKRKHLLHKLVKEVRV
jgi:hypothetical protein